MNGNNHGIADVTMLHGAALGLISCEQRSAPQRRRPRRRLVCEARIWYCCCSSRASPRPSACLRSPCSDLRDTQMRGHPHVQSTVTRCKMQFMRRADASMIARMMTSANRCISGQINELDILRGGSGSKHAPKYCVIIIISMMSLLATSAHANRAPRPL